MNKAKPIEELIQAYQQGFLSEQDYNARLAQLSDISDDETGANSTLLDESGQLIKQALKSDMAADMAKGAAGGAVIASVVPLVGTLTGAAVGAAFGAFKNLTKH